MFFILLRLVWLENSQPEEEYAYAYL